MKKIGISTIIICLFNVIAFTLDAFNTSIDLLKWTDMPPFEAYLMDWGMIDSDKIENIVATENYDYTIKKNIRYENDIYTIDCSGNQSGLIISTDEESELWYDFNYITDVYYYSRKKSFLDLTSQLCDKKINLSLILYQNIETEKDSLIGIILF